MGNKVSCTRGNKEDKEDAKAERKEKNKPIEKKPDEKVAASTENGKPAEVGTVEIERNKENQESAKEEVITAVAVAAVAAEKPVPTEEAAKQETKDESKPEKEAETQEHGRVSDAADGVNVTKVETMEISEDVVKRVTIETMQVSMTQVIAEDDEAAEAKGSSKAVQPKVEQYDSPEDRAKARENFLLRFREDVKLHAVDFMRIWKNYDKDKSGYIEGKELTDFIKNLLAQRGEKTNKKTVADYVNIMMSTFDYNKDGKLEIGELAQLLPTEHNFLDKFPEREKCSGKDFDKVYDHYDKDKSGFIGHTELIALLHDMFQKEGPRKMPMQDMTNYADAVFEIYDTTQDGRLSKEELGLILSKK